MHATGRPAVFISLLAVSGCILYAGLYTEAEAPLSDYSAPGRRRYSLESSRCRCVSDASEIHCTTPHPGMSLFFVPGLGATRPRSENGGKPTRFSVVNDNVDKLDPAQWCCVVSVYAHYDALVVMQRRFGYLSHCHLIDSANRTYTQSLAKVTPRSMRAAGFSDLTVALDDVELTPGFDVGVYRAKFEQSGADVASPSVYMDDWLEMQVGIRPTFFGWVNRPAPAQTPWGWQTPVFEPQMATFRAETWACVHSFLMPTVDPRGWGVFSCMHLVCNITRQAIISGAVAVHRGRQCCTLEGRLYGFGTTVGSAGADAEGDRWLGEICRTRGLCDIPSLGYCIRDIRARAADPAPPQAFFAHVEAAFRRWLEAAWLVD